jgi:predicted secreted protein
MMKNLLLALAIASCFTLIGCDVFKTKHEATKSDVVKNFPSATLSASKDFTITLAEDPSTNTKWVIESKPDFVELIDENKRSYSATKQDRRFTFRPKTSGSGNLVFVLKGWGDAEVKQRSTFPVTVE